MKNTKWVLLALASMLGVVFACKDNFLDVPATGSLSDAELGSQKGIEGALISSYSMLTGRGNDFYTGSSNWFWGSVVGGEATKGSNAGDQSQMNEVMSYSTLPSNSSSYNKYKADYEGIVRANSTLALLAKATTITDSSVVRRIRGEARFLRGHYYFDLKKIFNNTPYVDQTSGSAIVVNDKDLWPFIEADFKYAYDNLPETQGAVGRANKWAAGAYLAKTYLYERKYAEAKAVFDAVIANGKTAGGLVYGLVAKYSDLFNANTSDNNQESVFAIQAAVNTGSTANANPDFILNFPYNTGSNGPAGCCGFFQPTFELVNSFRTSASGLPLLDGSYNNAANEVKSDMGLASSAAFTPDAGNLDPRLDRSVGRRGIPYLNWQDHPGNDWIRDQSYGGPYSPKKFVFAKGEDHDVNSWGGSGLTGINVSIIRFADVLLMAAECEVELNNLEKARTYVNLVRTRASNPTDFVTKNGTLVAKYTISTYPGPWTDQATARAAVRFERKLELSGEGHRFFDLVRWGNGNAKSLVDAFLAEEKTKLPTTYKDANFVNKKSEYQPIPQAEIDLVGRDKLKQNDGYN